MNTNTILNQECSALQAQMKRVQKAYEMAMEITSNNKCGELMNASGQQFKTIVKAYLRSLEEQTNKSGGLILRDIYKKTIRVNDKFDFVSIECKISNNKLDFLANYQPQKESDTYYFTVLKFDFVLALLNYCKSTIKEGEAA